MIPKCGLLHFLMLSDITVFEENISTIGEATGSRLKSIQSITGPLTRHLTV